MARPKDLARREEILKSCLKVLRKHGRWDLSLNEIARQTKTTTRLLVHHFATKENLLRECRSYLERHPSLDFSSAPPQKNWKNQVCTAWQLSLQKTRGEDRRLRLISVLQNPRKTSNLTEKDHTIESLRELLPSRMQKFAEDVFIYATGLDLYVLSGGDSAKAADRLRNYLKGLDSA